MEQEKKDVIKKHHYKKERKSHPHSKRIRIKRLIFQSFWFLIGFILTASILISTIVVIFQNVHKNKSFDGVFIGSTYVGNKKRDEIEAIFEQKNLDIQDVNIVFAHDGSESTASASTLKIGYDAKLIADQAYNLGRSNNLFSNLYFIVSTYFSPLSIPPSFTVSQGSLWDALAIVQNKVYTEPVDALFTVENGKVVAFRESSDGKTVDFSLLTSLLLQKIPELFDDPKQKIIYVTVPILTTKPNVSTENANNLGIVEPIGEGTSYFKGSIPNRMHNVMHASSKLNGVLIAPGEVFSFNQVLGDISKLTGYKEAYVIKDGKTVLGDGGGVCQVSTTLFRALLNAGLPILERHAHAYRVYYYEQNSPPGLDATVYAPSYDLKFKNDTNSYILIQTVLEPEIPRLTFLLYGKKDGRISEVTKPVITSQTPPPPAVYQDDPTLQKDVIQQTEHEAWGATVTFGRTVTKDGKILYADTFNSRYTPWKAVYLKGTKE